LVCAQQGASMIRLLISDDSAFMRIAIRKMVEGNPDIQVVGEAKTGQMCVEMCEQLKPDVITMDVEMPVMDGLEATRQIMARFPTPIIMLSSLTERNSVTTIKALELGAVDFIAKKSSFVQLDIVKIGEDLVEKLQFWAKKKTRVALANRGVGNPASAGLPAVGRAIGAPIDTSIPVSVRKVEAQGTPGLVVLGISTGGPATLPQTLKAMGRLSCPMVVAQHMPPMFTSGFAMHLRTETGLDVVESTDGMELKPGMVVIIKGGTDAVVREPFPGKMMLYERTQADAPIHPNADVLFRSAASVSTTPVAVIMTGMGSDGMQGAKDLVQRKSCAVLAQEPSSCIVDGMPSSVIQAGLASAVLNPHDLGVRLARLAGQSASSVKIPSFFA
jgi:two-component system, chemotaxis family, protein-glutamate methylesterase/glutaminase